MFFATSSSGSSLHPQERPGRRREEERAQLERTPAFVDLEVVRDVGDLKRCLTNPGGLRNVLVFEMSGLATGHPQFVGVGETEGVQLARSRRIAVVLALLVLALGMSVFTSMAFLRSNPPTVDFTSGHKAGEPVNMTVQTVGSIGFGPHPTWVSYLTMTPGGKWVHTTLWQLPAHTRVNVTILQYDTGSPLRNQFIGHVTGTIGGTMTVNGRTTSLINSYGANGVGHTFTVPSLGIDVPPLGNLASAKNFCGAAPCTTSSAHNVVKFSFMTPGPGEYPWQCFVPCGLGYLYGNGGPMQTIGYMDGFLDVVS